MRITVIGSGYVGLVSGTCFAEFGLDVVCVDRDPGKIEKLNNGEIPIYEPGLEDLVAKQVREGRLSFTTGLDEAVRDAMVVFIAVGTPQRDEDGAADLGHVYSATREIARAMDGYTVLVTKSTVPVGTADALKQCVRKERPDADFDIASNPEFLREGAAINDFMRPDRVIIGTKTKRAQDIMGQIYRPLYINETPIVHTTPETAELIKYASNAFLATKITFINEMAELCERVGGNVQDVARGMGLDGRIGPKFLHAGPGYGGSCFPKDTRALVRAGQHFQARQSITEAVVAANDARRESMAGRVVEAAGGDVSGKRIALLGLAFKPNTDDVRESPALEMIPACLDAGAQLSVFDPAAMATARAALGEDVAQGVEWCEHAYETADGADVLVILTEWNQFRALDLERLRNIMNGTIIVDLRNIYKCEEMAEYGFTYYSIGRPPVLPDTADAVKSVSSG
jgi:UDPglucose 6-dehydrogenase